MLPDDLVIIVPKKLLAVLAALVLEAEKLLQLPFPGLIQDFLRAVIRPLSQLAQCVKDSPDRRVGSPVFAKLTGTATPAATNKIRTGKVRGAQKGPSGRWTIPISGIDEYLRDNDQDDGSGDN